MAQTSPTRRVVTPSAAAALFIVATSLLNPGDHLVVMHPNYATNIETPLAIGCQVDYLRLSFENGSASTSTSWRPCCGRRPN